MNQITPGQLAYEEDCRRMPLYSTGQVRKFWQDQPQFVRDSWERNPTPRNWGHSGL